MIIHIKDSEWGLYNTESGIIAPCEYSKIEDFVDGLAIVCKEKYHSLYGIINEEGKTVVPIIYDGINRNNNHTFNLQLHGIKCSCNKEGLLIDQYQKPFEELFQSFDIVKAISKNLYQFIKGEKEGVIYKKEIILDYKMTSNEASDIKSICDNFFSVNKTFYNTKGERAFPDCISVVGIDNKWLIVRDRKLKYGLNSIDGTVLIPCLYVSIKYKGHGIFNLEYDKEILHYFWIRSKKGKDYWTIDYNAENNLYITGSPWCEYYIPGNYDWCGSFDYDYAAVIKNGKYGFVSTEGKEFCPCEYDEVKYCNGKVAIVSLGHKWFLINDGNEKISEDYLDIDGFVYEDRFCIVTENHKRGLIDINGKTILPCNYIDIKYSVSGFFEAESWLHGLIWNKIDTKGQIHMEEGQIILSTKYKSARMFHSGLAMVEDKNGFRGYINSKGEEVIPCLFKGDLSDFTGNKATLKIDFEKDKIFKINKEGHFIVKYNNEDKVLKCYYKLAYDYIYDTCKVYNGSLFGLIDKSEKLLLPYEYEDITPITSNFFKIKKNDLYGIADSVGNIIVNCNYKKIKYNNSDSVFECECECDSDFMGIHSWKPTAQLIGLDGKLICKEGNQTILITSDYDKIYDFNEGVAKALKKGKFGIIDEKSRTLIDCKYDKIRTIFNGHAFCVLGEDKFLISFDGKSIPIKRYYNDACFESKNCIVVSYKSSNFHNSYSIVDNNGKEKSGSRNCFDSIGHFVNGTTWFKKKEYEDTVCGIVNKNSQIIYETFANRIEYLPRYDVYRVNMLKKYDDSVYININRDGSNVVFNGDLAIIAPNNYYILRDYKNGVSVVGKKVPIANKKTKLLWGLLNLNQQEVIPCNYDSINDFKSKYTEAAFHSKYGIIDEEGKVIIPFEYQELTIIDEELIKAKKDDLYGYIDFNGKEVIPISYEDISCPSEGLIAVARKDKRGNPLRKDWPEFDFSPEKVIYEYGNGERGWSYIDINNNIKIDLGSYIARDFHDGLAAISNNCDWKYIDKNGSVAIEGHFMKVSDFQNGKALVTFYQKKDGRYNSYNDNFSCSELVSKGTFYKDLIEGGSYYIHKDGSLNLTDTNNVKIDLKDIEFLGHFNNNHAPIKTLKGWGFINGQGEIKIFKALYLSDFVGGISDCYFDYDYPEGNWGWQYINSDYRIVMYDGDGRHSVVMPKECVAARRLGGCYELLNSKGECSLLNKNLQTVAPYAKRKFSYDNEDNIISGDDGIKFNYGGEPIAFDSYYPWKIISSDYEKWGSEFAEGLLPVYKNKFAGLINNKDEVIIPCNKYDDINCKDGKVVVSNNLIGVESNGKWGFVNTEGKLIIPCEFDAIFDNDHELRVSHDLIGVMKSNKWGCIDYNSNLCVPYKYDKIISIKGNFCIIGQNNSKAIGLVNNRGEEVIPFRKYDRIEIAQDEIKIYSETYLGKESHSVYSTKLGYARLIDKEGNLLSSYNNKRFTLPHDIEWCDAYFHHGFLSVYKKGKWGAININGELVIPCKYDSSIYFQNGIAIADLDGGKVALNTLGEEITECKYDNIDVYPDNNIIVCNNLKYDKNSIRDLNEMEKNNYIRIQNETAIVDFTFYSINTLQKYNLKANAVVPLSKGFFKYKLDGKLWGLARLEKGRIHFYLKCEFDDIAGVGYCLVAASKNSKWGYVKLNGEEFIEFTYERTLPFNRGIAIAKDSNNKRYGLLGLNGKPLTGFVYDVISDFNKEGELIASSEDNKHKNSLTEEGLIHIKYQKKNHEFFPGGIGYETIDLYLNGYDWCDVFVNNTAIVYKDHHEGLIDGNGKEILHPFDRGNISIIRQGAQLFYKKEETRIYEDDIVEFRQINNHGQITIDGIPLPSDIYWCDKCFSHGLISVYKDGKWGVMDTSLNYILNPEFKRALILDEDKIICNLTSDGKNTIFIYDIKLNKREYLKYDDCIGTKNGYAIVSKYNTIVTDEDYFDYDDEDLDVTEEYNKLLMNELLYGPMVNKPKEKREVIVEKYGIIDKSGTEIIPCVYSDMRFDSFEEDNSLIDDLPF